MYPVQTVLLSSSKTVYGDIMKNVPSARNGVKSTCSAVWSLKLNYFFRVHKSTAKVSNTFDHWLLLIPRDFALHFVAHTCTCTCTCRSTSYVCLASVATSRNELPQVFRRHLLKILIENFTCHTQRLLSLTYEPPNFHISLVSSLFNILTRSNTASSSMSVTTESFKIM